MAEVDPRVSTNLKLVAGRFIWGNGRGRKRGDVGTSLGLNRGARGNPSAFDLMLSWRDVYRFVYGRVGEPPDRPRPDSGNLPSNPEGVPVLLGAGYDLAPELQAGRWQPTEESLPARKEGAGFTSGESRIEGRRGPQTAGRSGAGCS